MTKNLKNILEENVRFTLNGNQFNDIARLLHEITKRDDMSDEDILRLLAKNKEIKKTKGKAKFQVIKQLLISLRFPLTSSQEKINSRDVFLSQIKPHVRNTVYHIPDFLPEIIFIEKSAKNSYLAERFQARFPDTPKEELNHLWEYAQKNKFKLNDLKKPLLS